MRPSGFLTAIALTFFALSSSAERRLPATQFDLSKIPADALEYLSNLPGQTITMDFVVSRSIETSDQFKIVEAQVTTIPVSELQAKSPYDFEFSLGASRIINENEQISPFSPNKILATEYSAGVSKFFSTGTLVATELTHGKTDIMFAPAAGGSSIAAFESSASISIQQQLWKNFFGSGSRASLESGELQKEAANLEYQNSVDEWTVGLISFYYRAWLAQARARAAFEGVKRRERLLKITRIRTQRGTAVKPDLLQVESALLKSKALYSDAQQDAEEIWRQLITTLKLPKNWMSIDPVLVPISMDDPISPALRLCGVDGEVLSAPKDKSINIKSAALTADAALRAYDSANTNTDPDLRLFLSLESNGVDAEAGTSFSETLTSDHPAWTLGLTLTFPLNRFEEEAALLTATANRDRGEAMRSKSIDDFEVDWLNACSNFRRLNLLRDEYLTAFEKQSERVKLEENRFRIGRTPMLNVIQAGDDATNAELDVRQAEVNARISAWTVRRYANQVQDYVQYLKTEYRKKTR